MSDKIKKSPLGLCLFLCTIAFSALAFNALFNSHTTAAATCRYNPDAGCYEYQGLYDAGAAVREHMAGAQEAMDAFSGEDQCAGECTLTIEYTTGGYNTNSGYNPATGKFQVYANPNVANGFGDISIETRVRTDRAGRTVTIVSTYKEPCHNPLTTTTTTTAPTPQPLNGFINTCSCDKDVEEYPGKPPEPTWADPPGSIASEGSTFAQAYVKRADTGGEIITGGSSTSTNTDPDALIVATPDMVAAGNGSSETTVYAKPHDQVKINVSAKAAHIGCYYEVYYAQTGHQCPASSASVSNDLGNSGNPRTDEDKTSADGSRISIIHGYRTVTAEDVGRVFTGHAEATPTNIRVDWNQPDWVEYVKDYTAHNVDSYCRIRTGTSCSGENGGPPCRPTFRNDPCKYTQDWIDVTDWYIKDWKGRHNPSGSSSKTVHIEVPYNYDVEIPSLIPCNTDGNPPCAEWPNYGITYAGEDRKFEFSVNTKPVKDSNFDEPVATNTRPSTYEIISFVTTAEGYGMPTGREDSAFHGGNGTVVYSSAPPAGSSCGYYTAGTSRARECVVVQQRQNIWFNTNTNGAPNNVNTKGNTDTSVYTLDGTRLESIQPSVVIDDLPAGSKFCIALSVWPNDVYHGLGDSSASSWLHGAPHCLTIAKKPSTQFWGAGVFSAGDITTSQSVKYVPDANGFRAGNTYNSKYHNGLSDYISDTDVDNARRAFGSWSEYEAISTRNIKGLATGAALGYNPLGTSTIGGNFNSTRPAGFPTSYDASNTFSSGRICNYSSQTFANSNNNTECQANSITMGNSNILSNIDLTLSRLISRYSTSTDARSAPAKDTITIGGIGSDAHQSASGDGNVKNYSSSSSNVTLRTNGIIPAGGTITITVPSTLTIDSDIIYEDSYTNIADLPQVLIFADSININPNVSRIDAWLVVGQISKQIDSGVLNTCTDFTVGTSGINACDDRSLTINGPVFAERLELNRTAGAGAGHESITPAERFNLRADAYLWSYAEAQRYSQAVVTYSRELAPRY